MKGSGAGDALRIWITGEWEGRLQVVTGTFPCGQQLVKYGYKEKAECILCKEAHEESGKKQLERRAAKGNNLPYSKCGMPWTKGSSHGSAQYVHPRAATGD